MCNLYSITTNQAAIAALFKRMNRYVGNLPPMPGVFPDYPAPVIRNTDIGTEMVTMRWSRSPPPRMGGPPFTKSTTRRRRLAQAREPLSGSGQQLCRVRARAVARWRALRQRLTL